MYQASYWNGTPDLSYPAIILSANIPVVVACVPYLLDRSMALSHTLMFSLSQPSRLPDSLM